MEAGKVRVSDKTRKPSQATVETILPLLSDGDFYQAEERIEYAKDTGQDLTIRAYAWPCILQAAGLVSLVGGRLELSREGRKALTRQPEVTIRDAWKKWDATKLFDEFDRVEQVKGKSSTGSARWPIVAALWLALSRNARPVAGSRSTISSGS